LPHHASLKNGRRGGRAGSKKKEDPVAKSFVGRTLLLVTLILALLVIGGVMIRSNDVMAASNCTYYNNANHTAIIGQFGYDCCNNPVAWGRKTSYYVCGGCFPCTPPPQ
jgi:hypothetical protein